MCASYYGSRTIGNGLAAEIDQIARGHLAEVERKLADLTMLRGELRQLIDQCQRGTVAECRIIEALAPRA